MILWCWYILILCGACFIFFLIILGCAFYIWNFEMDEEIRSKYVWWRGVFACFLCILNKMLFFCKNIYSDIEKNTFFVRLLISFFKEGRYNAILYLIIRRSFDPVKNMFFFIKKKLKIFIIKGKGGFIWLKQALKKICIYLIVLGIYIKQLFITNVLLLFSLCDLLWCNLKIAFKSSVTKKTKRSNRKKNNKSS